MRAFEFQRFGFWILNGIMEPYSYSSGRRKSSPETFDGNQRVSPIERVFV